MHPKSKARDNAVLFHANDFDYDEFVAAQEEGPSSPLPERLPIAEAEALLAQAAGDTNWDAFYQRETDPYKPRRYLSAEFPELLQTEVTFTGSTSSTTVQSSSQLLSLQPSPEDSTPLWSHFFSTRLPTWLGGRGPQSASKQLTCDGRTPLLLDVGCGYGSALLPLLKENQHLRAVACDLSATAIGLLKKSLKKCPSFEKRVRTRAWDITHGPPPELVPSPLPGCSDSTAVETADLALLVFTLSAINPSLHVSVLRSLEQVLTPGTGMICFRDRARYDKTMLRSKRRIGDSTYARDDGTLAHYFTTEEITALATAAGLELVAPAEYCTVRQPNRRKGTVMNSCYVHAKLRRPLAAAAGGLSPHKITPPSSLSSPTIAATSGTGLPREPPENSSCSSNGKSEAQGRDKGELGELAIATRARSPWALGVFTAVLAAASAAISVNLARKFRTRL